MTFDKAVKHRLSVDITRSVVQDRKQRLNDKLLQDGCWNEICRFHRGFRKLLGPMRGTNGETVDSDKHATGQIHALLKCSGLYIRLLARHSDRPLDKFLPVSFEDISEKRRSWTVPTSCAGIQACGNDDVPAKLFIQHVSGQCGTRNSALVAAVFKNDDPCSCENYRPISLISVGHNFFVMIWLTCLRHAGAKRGIWPTQFGFRRGNGCADALFIARRLLEDAWSIA